MIKHIAVCYTSILKKKKRMALDRSIAYALQKIGCSSVTLKHEHMMCIKYIYGRKDMFLWLPTGFGKFLCYEVLTFVFDDKHNR